MRAAGRGQIAVRAVVVTAGALAAVALGLRVSDAQPADQAPASPYVARTVTSFTPAAEAGLFMPTGVAADERGRVFVADGVNDRVVVFAADGRLVDEIRTAGDRPLSNPLSVRVVADGVLWIADQGNQRAVALASDGRLLHEVGWPVAAGEPLADITDVAPTADGRAVWLVDNDHHRLGRVDLATGAVQVVGGIEGPSLGQLDYPFSLAIASTGDVLVSEALNGRVQVFSPDGRPAGSIGSYGVSLGQLFRPKRLAIGPDGNVWVVDGVLGVVQVFRPSGGLIDVVRDEGGAAVKFNAPCGIAFGPDGALLVTELLPSNVQRVDVAIDEAAVARTVGARAPASRFTQQQVCTTCHINWIEPLASGRNTEIFAAPVDEPGAPVPAGELMCLSCHDGSVDDSRQRVWARHGHQTGIVPPAEMPVPANLPLVAGKIACRTCHSAHTRGGAGDVIADAIFLRVENEPAELCRDCHGGLAGGPGAGMHPLGETDQAIPAALVSAGAITGGSERAITCTVCHQGHGSTDDLLLLHSASGNDLCLSCHADMSPGRFIDRGPSSGHPTQPLLNDVQLAAVHDIGGQVGDNQTLVCLSCHEMHHAKSERFVLNHPLAGNELCIRCHAEQAVVVGSEHDLRTNHPELRNVHDVTVAEGGPCSACHLFHDYARQLTPTPLDVTGQCVTCHQPGAVAAASVLGPVNHPNTNCQQCHNPHSVAQPAFLAAPAAELCVSCHAPQSELVGGAHDLTNDPGSWPADAVATDSRCLACHKPHGDEQTGLWRAGLAADAPNAMDAVCLACHEDSRWLHGVNVAGPSNAMVHPAVAGGERKLQAGALEPWLVPGPDGEEMLGCRTCHDPHAGPIHADPLLRLPAEQSSVALCVECHEPQHTITLTGHRPEEIERAGYQSDGCRPCHVVHSDPSKVTLRTLWPKDLSLPEGVPLPNDADDHCISCHRAGGSAPAPPVSGHADVPLTNVMAVDSPGYFPLYTADGVADPQGRITCRTCHIPHGREDSWQIADAFAPLPSARANALKLHLRPYALPNVCSSCHGADALRRYLYYHEPLLRGGPITQEPPTLPAAR